MRLRSSDPSAAAHGEGVESGASHPVLDLRPSPRLTCLPKRLAAAARSASPGALLVSTDALPLSPTSCVFRIMRSAVALSTCNCRPARVHQHMVGCSLASSGRCVERWKGSRSKRRGAAKLACPSACMPAETPHSCCTHLQADDIHQAPAWRETAGRWRPSTATGQHGPCSLAAAEHAEPALQAACRPAHGPGC